MSIQFNCPHCDRHYKVDEKYAGKLFACKECREPIRAPLVSQVSVAEVAPAFRKKSSRGRASDARPSPPAIAPAILTIHAVCPHCGRPHNVEVKHAGKLIRCKKCAEPFRVPTSAHSTAGSMLPTKPFAEPQPVIAPLGAPVEQPSMSEEKPLLPEESLLPEELPEAATEEPATPTPEISSGPVVDQELPPQGGPSLDEIDVPTIEHSVSDSAPREAGSPTEEETAWVAAAEQTESGPAPVLEPSIIVTAEDPLPVSEPSHFAVEPPLPAALEAGEPPSPAVAEAPAAEALEGFLRAADENEPKLFEEPKAASIELPPAVEIAALPMPEPASPLAAEAFPAALGSEMPESVAAEESPPSAELPVMLETAPPQDPAPRAEPPADAPVIAEVDERVSVGEPPPLLGAVSEIAETQTLPAGSPTPPENTLVTAPVAQSLPAVAESTATPPGAAVSSPGIVLPADNESYTPPALVQETVVGEPPPALPGEGYATPVAMVSPSTPMAPEPPPVVTREVEPPAEEPVATEATVASEVITSDGEVTEASAAAAPEDEVGAEPAAEKQVAEAEADSALENATIFTPPEQQEVAESGSPIYRHQPRPGPSAIAPPLTPYLAHITNHIERTIGPLPIVLHEIISVGIHIDLHVVPPSRDPPSPTHPRGSAHFTIVTAGLSSRPMNVPPGCGFPAHAELMICLPVDWPGMKLDGTLDTRLMRDEAHWWPLRWLKAVARMPHEYNTFLGPGHTIPNGPHATAFSEHTRLGCMLVQPSLLNPRASRLVVSSNVTIQFYALWPLYPEEMELKQNVGIDALLRRFQMSGTSELIQLDRKNVAAQR